MFTKQKQISRLKFAHGFTLVEMLVSIAVFMIVVTVAVGALYSIIDADRKALSIKNVMNNVNFALESISRDMRMGGNYICETTTCDSDNSDNIVSYEIDNPNNPGTNMKVYYKFTKNPNEGEGNIQRKKVIVGGEGWESLTAPVNTVLIKNMKFYVTPADNNNQGKVQITLEGESGLRERIKTSFALQTTVTQRERE